ncbi:hypothetical protein AB0L05_41840 [Nonomuraea pusilla]|uniref:hypothetical protein n=1 Tax=Nonomuraea pusilla TaxID=46177 RepID=UPI0033235E82
MRSGEVPVLLSPSAARPTRRHGRWAGWLIVPPVLLALAVLIPVWAHDARLDEMVRRVTSFPLPPRTIWADPRPQGSVGLQAGNGNRCDYVVRISLTTSLSGQEIADYYRGSPLGGKVYVEQDAPEGGTRGVVVEFTEMHDPGWDLRCH